MTFDKDTAMDQAKEQVKAIVEMVNALGVDYDRIEELRELGTKYEAGLGQRKKGELADLEERAGDCKSQDEARTRIDESALSVEVRGGWHSPGTGWRQAAEPFEFRILLCTGGPHVELVGALDDYNQPVSVRVIYMDWGTSGELSDFDKEAVLIYCQQFFFGE